MQQLWRKRYVLVGWITLSAVSLVLLIAAIHTKNHKVCKGIHVEIDSAGNNFFVDTKQVIKILTSTDTIKGAPLENIHLRMLEDRLKQDKWIANAELFFDNDEVLQVKVEEKDPVARIFTVGGSSFYIDSACNRLPLSDKLSARVPMFTSFPSDRLKLSRPDSALMASVKDMAMFINADNFWKAQVSQIDITPIGFEMVPTIGNHIVELGNSEDLKEKFDRLYSFYKQVSTQVGFDKYERIAVQYQGQVVATKRGTALSSVDTAKAKVALNELLAKSKKATELADDDSMATSSSSKPVVAAQKATTEKKPAEISERSVKQPTKVSKEPKLPPNKRLVVKAAVKPAAIKNKEQDKQDKKLAEHAKVPKAVMKKKGQG